MRPPWRSIEGISTWSVLGRCSHSDGDMAGVQVVLQFADARVVVMKDRRGERGICAAIREDVVEVLHFSRSSGCDHGNVHGTGDGGSHFAIETRTRPVPIHRGKQDLSGAA